MESLLSETSSETTCTDSDFSDLYREEECYWWSIARWRLINRFIFKYSASINPRILDVGCGGGGFLGTLKDSGSVFGLEHSAIGARYAAVKAPGRVVRGNAEKLPFKDQSFDILTSLDVIEHLDNDLDALKGFHRVLSNGGTIILMVPALDLLWSPRDILLRHKRRYTVKRLNLLVENSGFKILKCSYTNSFYFPGLLLYSLVKKVSRQKQEPKTAIMALPSWIAILFDRILIVEEFLLEHINLPIGTSIICVARKKD